MVIYEYFEENCHSKHKQYCGTGLLFKLDTHFSIKVKKHATRIPQYQNTIFFSLFYKYVHLKPSMTCNIKKRISYIFNAQIRVRFSKVSDPDPQLPLKEVLNINSLLQTVCPSRSYPFYI